MINRILAFAALVRYRFFLVAGLFPFFLGAAIAAKVDGVFHLKEFFIALAGLFFILVAVEAFNEYFDSRLGSDRIFEKNPKEIPGYMFKIGLVSFFLGGCVAVYLTITRGAVVAIIAALGFLAAAFYVGPPIRWVYRGVGELVIALSYGPFMTMGSYYVMTKRIDMTPLFVSLLPAILVLGLGIANAIPDYYGDRLVGKKNIVVRLGKKRSMVFFSMLYVLFFAFVILGLFAGKLPLASCFILALIPLAVLACRKAFRYLDDPHRFVVAIRHTVILYLGSMFILVLGFIV